MGIDCTFALGLVRNHYVGRTFIAPTQDARELKVRCKFNTVSRVLAGKVVVLVDDSIVRGTTSTQLVKYVINLRPCPYCEICVPVYFVHRMVRRAGAREVHFRVASPPVSSPCFYGMDFPSKEELLANQYDDVEEMSRALGTVCPSSILPCMQSSEYFNALFDFLQDSLKYLSPEGLLNSAYSVNSTYDTFCTACFTEKYPVPVDLQLQQEFAKKFEW